MTREQVGKVVLSGSQNLSPCTESRTKRAQHPEHGLSAPEKTSWIQQAIPWHGSGRARGFRRL